MGQRPNLTRRRRLQILDAAVEVIADRGLAETRIADVAARAGTSAALVLYYFDSKHHLLTEALTHAEDRFYLETFAELSDVESAPERLLRLIELACFPGGVGGSDFSDWTLWVELWSSALRDPVVRRRRESLDRRWRSTIADIVRAGQRSGNFVGIDADDFALRLGALIDGLAIQVLLGDPEVTPDRMRDLCVEMAGRELGVALGRAAPTTTPNGMAAERR